jgi:hypothetical protein
MTWTQDAIESVKAMVATIAGALIPGWELEFVFADSMAQTGGALAYCIPQPRREKAKIVIAPHPPDESLRETIAHELGHAWVSPLVELIEPSEAAITIEEVLIERFSKFAASHPGLVGALARVTRNPRTKSAIVRQRISALATGRIGKGKHRMMTAEQAQKALDALVAGDSEAAMAVLKEMIAGAMSGGGGDGPESAPMREEAPEGKPAPAMREEEVPAPMREQYRRARTANASMLKDTIRLRLHTARTVDGITLDAETERDLSKAATIEQFDREFRLVTRQAAKGGERTRQRSGVVAEETVGGSAMKFDDLIKEGIPAQQARDLVELSAKNRAAADAELSGARIRLRQMGGAK